MSRITAVRASGFQEAATGSALEAGDHADTSRGRVDLVRVSIGAFDDDLARQVLDLLEQRPRSFSSRPCSPITLSRS